MTTALSEIVALPVRPRNQVLIPTVTEADLSPEHNEFRITQRAGLDVPWFCYEVCKDLVALPEARIDYRWHLPVQTPGYMGGTGFGWRIADYMLIGPICSQSDIEFRTCLRNFWGHLLAEQAVEAGLPLADMLVTHAVRFPMPTKDMKPLESHKKACAVYARMDCEACQPRVIVTLGSDALKVLYGKTAKLDTYRGSVHEWKGIPVVPTCNPFVFVGSTAGIDVFRSELARAVDVGLRNYVSGACLMKPDYRVCQTVEEVVKLRDDMEADSATLVSFDTEYGNLTGREEDGLLRTIQFSWAAGKAALVVIRGVGCTEIHTPEQLNQIRELLRQIMDHPARRLEGHQLRGDIKAAGEFEINLDHKLATGFCTLLARNLLHGSTGDESDGLDHLIRAYVPEFGNYWKELEEWLSTGSAVRPDGIKLSGRPSLLAHGYGYVPDEILFPYALRDADATWQAARKVEAELDQHPKLKSLFWNLVMPTALHLLDVERQGILVDQARLREIHYQYQPVYEALLERFRDTIGWPKFNPSSSKQRTSLLFSTSKFKDKKPLPEGVRGLSFTPYCNTDKYPKLWTDIVADHKELQNSPCTKANILDLMYTQSLGAAKTDEEKADLQVLKMLKHLSVLSKFLSTYLVLPKQNRYGEKEDGKSFQNNICRDGRVRTHFHQTSETGRYRSFKANLQTNPNKQETAALEVLVDYKFDGMTPKEYLRRTDDVKAPADLIPKEDRIKLRPFKSCYVPAPGYTLMEADFKTAELCIVAFVSGDVAMSKAIDQERDIHSETAVRCFQLPEGADLPAALAAIEAGDSKPYKAWTKRVKSLYDALRTAAKAVLFGLLYGRSAGALAREIGKVVPGFTQAQGQAIIDYIASTFPQVWAFLKAAAKTAVENEYLETVFDRCRYFPGAATASRSVQAAIARQAMNCGIQGAVADLLAQAGINLYNFRYHTETGRRLGFRIILPVHDAFYFEVPNESVNEMKTVIELCMRTMNPIPKTNGRRLGVDISVYPNRLGEKPKAA